VRKGRAIGIDGGADQRGEIETLPLAVRDGFLDPGGGTHGGEDRAEALAAFAGTCHVGAGVLAHAARGLGFRLQVLERGADDGQRGADLVGQLAGQGAQVAGVLVQPAEQRREAAREVAELVAGLGLGQHA